MSKILIVDDEQDLCEILQFNLESEGYEVDTANSAEEGLKKLNSQHMLILLDVMMEDMSGFQMANKIRKELNNDVPIIFLTAKDTENDMLTGFNVGGDDYITKPFSLKAVMARVKAVIKRSAKSATAAESIIDTFKYKSLQINYETKNEIQNLKREADKDIRERKNVVVELEHKLTQREESLDRRSLNLDKREESLNLKESKLDDKKMELEQLNIKVDELLAQQQAKLIEIAGLTREEAREIIMNQVKDSMSQEIALYIKEEEEKAKKAKQQ